MIALNDTRHRKPSSKFNSILQLALEVRQHDRHGQYLAVKTLERLTGGDILDHQLEVLPKKLTNPSGRKIVAMMGISTSRMSSATRPAGIAVHLPSISQMLGSTSWLVGPPSKRISSSATTWSSLPHALCLQDVCASDLALLHGIYRTVVHRD
jgi:hypothetical protein